jgi:hypothetical protein
MLYTHIPPFREADRVQLFRDAEAALSRAGRRGAFFAVAVRFDERGRRVIPTRVHLPSLDPTWATPAELNGDGSITAKGIIPRELYAVSFLSRSSGRSGLPHAASESKGCAVKAKRRPDDGST